MCLHPWYLTAGTPSHEGLVDPWFSFRAGIFRGSFPGPPSQEEWTGRWSRNSSEWSAIPHVARDLQTRNAARMDHGNADGAFWNLDGVGWDDEGILVVGVVVFHRCFRTDRKVLGMINDNYEGWCDPWSISHSLGQLQPCFHGSFISLHVWGAPLITLIFLIQIGEPC